MKSKIYTEMENCLKTCPHFITKDIWSLVKNIILHIRECSKPIFLNNSQISFLEKKIQMDFNFLETIVASGEFYEINEWIFDMIDYYYEKSLEYEEYEVTKNLLILIDRLSVKIK